MANILFNICIFGGNWRFRKQKFFTMQNQKYLLFIVGAMNETFLKLKFRKNTG